MFKSILRWLFRVKPAPAPAEKPPMAVRNKPNLIQRQIDASANISAIARINSGSHSVRSAGEAAARRQAEANSRQSDEHASMYLHSGAMGDFYSGGDSSSCDTSSSSSSSSCD